MRRQFLQLLSLTAILVSMGLSSGSLLGKEAKGAKEEKAAEREERIALAKGLLNHSAVSLLNFHVSGVRDQATAQQNLVQTSEGKPAKRSYYGNGPGGSVEMDLGMLKALMMLANEGFSYRITEFAGGSHSCNSRHYCGVGFDIDTLDGKKIGYNHPTYRAFMERCRALGATEVLGPGSRGHSTHLHVAWPRS